MEMKIRNNLYRENGDYFNEQLGGFAELIERYL